MSWTHTEQRDISSPRAHTCSVHSMLCTVSFFFLIYKGTKGCHQKVNCFQVHVDMSWLGHTSFSVRSSSTTVVLLLYFAGMKRERKRVRACKWGFRDPRLGLIPDRLDCCPVEWRGGQEKNERDSHVKMQSCKAAVEKK